MCALLALPWSHVILVGSEALSFKGNQKEVSIIIGLLLIG